MVGKSLLLLFLITACGKVATTNPMDADTFDVEVCDGVCVVEVAGDATQAVEIAQLASDTTDSQ